MLQCTKKTACDQKLDRTCLLIRCPHVVIINPHQELNPVEFCNPVRQQEKDYRKEFK
jgi:hypothetical protein